MNRKTLIATRSVLAILICLNLWLIFFFSSENGEESSERSDGVADVIAGVIVDGYEEMTPPEQSEVRRNIGLPIRKLAHITEYLTLSFLICTLVSTFTEKLIFRLSVGVAFSFLYAMSDELLHQGLVSGRAGVFTDVLIDSFGAILGAILAWVIYAKLTKLLKGNRKNENNEV